MNLRRWIIACLSIGLVVFCIWHWWPDDLRRVERRMNKLFEVVGKNGPESLPVSALRSTEAGSYLGSNVVLKLGEPFPSTMRRSDSIALLQQARMRVETLSVKSRGHEITRLPDGSIRTDITIDATVTVKGQQENILGSYRFDWAHDGEDWKIIEADALQVIEHPAGTTW